MFSVLDMALLPSSACFIHDPMKKLSHYKAVVTRSYVLVEKAESYLVDKYFLRKFNKIMPELPMYGIWVENIAHSAAFE